MTPRRDSLTRSQMIGGMLATGALVSCGGSAGAPPAAAPVSNCGVPAVDINKLFSDPIFKDLDKAELLAVFDSTPQIEALYQGYFNQPGQQLQVSNVIRQIPSTGIVIRSPGTYTFAGDILWMPNDVQCSAITIQCSNVTLDFAGYTLTASVADKAQQTAGILVLGPAANPNVSNITVTNGTIANVTEYGVFATAVCGLSISQIAVTGVCMQNIDTRFLTPAGIQVSGSVDVAISDCKVTQMNVTTDSSAGIFLLSTLRASVTRSHVDNLVNNDGAVIGFSCIKMHRRNDQRLHRRESAITLSAQRENVRTHRSRVLSDLVSGRCLYRLLGIRLNRMLR